MLDLSSFICGFLCGSVTVPEHSQIAVIFLQTLAERCLLIVCNSLCRCKALYGNGVCIKIMIHHLFHVRRNDIIDLTAEHILIFQVIKECLRE